jgi:hypothetical protein
VILIDRLAQGQSPFHGTAVDDGGVMITLANWRNNRKTKKEQSAGRFPLPEESWFFPGTAPNQCGESAAPNNREKSFSGGLVNLITPTHLISVRPKADR